MTTFALRRTPTLSRTGADRAEHLREDPDALAAGWSGAAVLRVDARSRVLVADGRVVLADATAVAAAPPEEAVFLGRLPDGRDTWAVRASLPTPDGPETVLDLRGAQPGLSDVSAQFLAAAAALLNWHDAARFSPVDGSPTRSARAGWVRVDRDGREHFPRLDPAVITLVHDGGDRVVLGRQATWPPGRFSLLAGFVEAGESFETCVAREIAEEVGLAVRDVTYLGSQPWPFPRSLMIGFHAVADPAEPFDFRDGEIVEAHWFDRGEVREALARGDWGAREPARLLLPGSISIAREIIESWAAAG